MQYGVKKTEQETPFSEKTIKFIPQIVCIYRSIQPLPTTVKRMALISLPPCICIYIYIYIQYIVGAKGDWDLRISDLVKTLMELKFNPCGEFRWSLEDPVSQIHSPHLHDGDPGISSDLLRSVQMLKREWGVESNGKLLHLFIPSETATMFPAFAVEDPAFGHNCSLGALICNERQALGQNTLMLIYIVYICRM